MSHGVTESCIRKASRRFLAGTVQIVACESNCASHIVVETLNAYYHHTCDNVELRPRAVVETVDALNFIPTIHTVGGRFSSHSRCTRDRESRGMAV